MTQLSNNKGESLTLLFALARAHRDGFRYAYLSVPRGEEYIKHFSGIKTCASLLVGQKRFADLNHSRWSYSCQDATIQSKNDANAAIVLL